MTELLAAKGNSLALGRDAAMIFGGTVGLGPVGTLIGLSAAISLESKRLQLEGYRLTVIAESGQRSYELAKQELGINQFRADTERIALEGSLYIEAASRSAAAEIHRMEVQVDAYQHRTRALGRVLALDTLAAKRQAASNRELVNHFSDHLKSAIQNAHKIPDSKIALEMIKYLGDNLVRFGTTSHGHSSLSADQIGEFLQVPDLVTLPKNSLRIIER